MPHQLSTDLAAVETALRDLPTSTITGAHLGSLIQSAAPTLDYRASVGIPRGPGALKEFVAHHLSGILERIGNQGDDILYRIDGREVSEAESEDIWKNFVSPSSPRHLVLQRGPQRLVSRLAPASAESDEVEINKASEAEHDSIRASFMADLPAQEASEISQHVPQNAKFPEWIAGLRMNCPDAVRKWGIYRKDQLLKLFTERVDALVLDAGFRDKVMSQIRASQRSAYKRQKEAGTARESELNRSSSIARLDVSDIGANAARSLAHIAVDLMSYDDLRSIRLPLGVMLDAFSTRD